MLKDLKMRTSQKVGLAVIFSLGIIIIIFEILRTVKSLEQSSFSEVAIYDIVENGVALIVSSIIHYRSFLSTRRRKRMDRQYVNLMKGSSSGGGRSNSYRLKNTRTDNLSDTSGLDNGYSISESHNSEGYHGTSVRIPEHVHV